MMDCTYADEAQNWAAPDGHWGACGPAGWQVEPQLAAQPFPQAAAPAPAEAGVRMVVQRTFIELVAPPAAPARARALSDTAALAEGSLASRLKTAGLPPVPCPEISDASTEAASDQEESPGALWQQPRPQDLQQELPQEQFTFDPAFACWEPGCGQFVPMAWVGPMMPGDAWAPMGYDYFGDFAQGPAVPVELDPSARWQWPQDAAQLGGGAEGPAGGASASADFQSQGAGSDGEEPALAPKRKTTVMLRNLPKEFTRDTLLELLEDEGFEGSFDFLYLPIDFGSKACLGYAFVNFSEASDADRCYQAFDGFQDWGLPSDKACEVTWGDPYQGLEAHVERYRNSPVMHHRVPDDWKPIVLEGGARVPFPPPTKNISAPKMRRRNGDKGEKA